MDHMLIVPQHILIQSERIRDNCKPFGPKSMQVSVIQNGTLVSSYLGCSFHIKPSSNVRHKRNLRDNTVQPPTSHTGTLPFREEFRLSANWRWCVVENGVWLYSPKGSRSAPLSTVQHNLTESWVTLCNFLSHWTDVMTVLVYLRITWDPGLMQCGFSWIILCAIQGDKWKSLLFI
jgi:hypothetical protein